MCGSRCFGGIPCVFALENCWSLLKRGISGTYVRVEPFYLFRYLDEQTFRYNHREGMSDGDRFDIAVRQIVGKRLTYDTPIGRDLLESCSSV